MFCTNCGVQIANDSRFCCSCGKAVTFHTTVAAPEPQMQINGQSKDALIRRANKIIENFDIRPQLPGFDIELNIDEILNFDPLYRFPQLKKHILDTLMKETAYNYDESYFNDVIAQTYTNQEATLQRKLLAWFINCSNSFVDSLSYRYTSFINLREDVRPIFIYAHCIMYVASVLKLWDHLWNAKLILKALTLFQCVKEPNGAPDLSIGDTGKFLTLRQFSRDRSAFQNMNNQIDALIMQYGSQELQNRLEQHNEEQNAKNKKVRSKRKRLIVARIIGSILTPILSVAVLLFIIYGIGAQEPMPIGLLGCVMIIPMTIITNTRSKHAWLIILLDTLYILLCYPLCLLISYIAAIAIVVFILIIVGLFVFIRK